jgi:PAS domain S-box-containing protein
MSTPPYSAALRFGVALLSVGVATLINSQLSPRFGEGLFHLTFYAAVMVSSWYGGIGPGLLASGLSALATISFSFPPGFSFSVSDESRWVEFLSFLLVMVTVAGFSEAMHAARRRAEKSRERYRQIVENSGEGICMTDAEARIGFVNTQMADMLGYGEEEMLKRTAFDFVFDEDLDDARRRFDSRKRGVKGHFDFRLRDKQGSVIWTQISADPLFDDKGNFSGVLAMVTDVSEIHERSQQAEETQKILDALMEYIPEGITIADPPDVSIRMISKYGRQLIDRPAESLERLPMNQHVGSWDIFHRDGVTRPSGDDLPLTRATLRGEVVLGEEWVLGLPNGQKLTVLCNAGPIRDKSGRIIAGIVTWQDITERKRGEKEREQLLEREKLARQEAERANRTKDKFLATVSHELRTPLTAILGWVTMFRKTKFDEGATLRAFEIIERNAKSQAQLIEDLLDVSRITSGKLRLDIEPMKLTSVIKAAIECVRPAADAKRVQIRIVLDSTDEPIPGDAKRLQQVVWNLLSNAVKFTQENGEVEIRLERVDSKAQITVSDNGQGIPPEFLPHVFERFEQGAGARGQSGLGLGLAIVAELVEMHGGTIEAHSEGIGRGSRFTVTLPMMPIEREKALEYEPAEVASSERTSTGRKTVDLSQVRVLAVDDEPETLEMLKRLLQQYGAHVMTAVCARDALDALQIWRPNVLVCDLGMPEEDGYSLINKIRNLAPQRGGDIPAVALSSHKTAEETTHALEAGYQMLVPKPVEAEELASVIAAVHADLYKTRVLPASY